MLETVLWLIIGAIALVGGVGVVAALRAMAKG